jgi:hypothetical protein
MDKKIIKTVVFDSLIGIFLSSIGVFSFIFTMIKNLINITKSDVFFLIFFGLIILSLLAYEIYFIATNSDFKIFRKEISKYVSKLMFILVNVFCMLIVVVLADIYPTLHYMPFKLIIGTMFTFFCLFYLYVLFLLFNIV